MEQLLYWICQIPIIGPIFNVLALIAIGGLFLFLVFMFLVSPFVKLEQPKFFR